MFDTDKEGSLFIWVAVAIVVLVCGIHWFQVRSREPVAVPATVPPESDTAPHPEEFVTVPVPEARLRTEAAVGLTPEAVSRAAIIAPVPGRSPSSAGLVGSRLVAMKRAPPRIRAFARPRTCRKPGTECRRSH